MQMNSCQFTPDFFDWMPSHAPLIPWFWTFSWLCASNVCTPFRGSYAFYAKIYNICSYQYHRKIMLLCGIHWHSRYSIWNSTFVLLHCMWFPGSSCVHKLLYLIICHGNRFIVSRLACMLHVHFILGKDSYFWLIQYIHSNWWWLESFPIEDYYYSNYRRVIFHPLYNSGSLYILLVSFLFLTFELIHCTNCVQSKWLQKTVLKLNQLWFSCNSSGFLNIQSPRGTVTLLLIVSDNRVFQSLFEYYNSFYFTIFCWHNIVWFLSFGIHSMRMIIEFE